MCNMKNFIKISCLLALFFLFSLKDAAYSASLNIRWYWVSYISWGRDISGNCGASKIPVDPYFSYNNILNPNSFSRTWYVKCYTPDWNAPVISISTNWYEQWKWTNAWVVLNVSIKDNPYVIPNLAQSYPSPWIKNSYYTINSKAPIDTTGVSDFVINFNEEWQYLVSFYAEDRSNLFSNWTFSSNGNISKKDFIVRIDKTAPVFSILPSASPDWKKEKPKVSFKIEDKYKWKSYIRKTFSCWQLSENSLWSAPADPVTWTFEWSCLKATDSDCQLDQNFLPNLSSCDLKCKEWYTEYQGSCFKSMESFSCTSSKPLPATAYILNKFDLNAVVQNFGYQWKVSRYDSPEWVDPNNWSFTSVFSNWIYDPSLSSCSYKCDDSMHVENFTDWKKCVNNMVIACCKKMPLWQVQEAAWAIQMDCTKSPSVYWVVWDTVKNPWYAACTPNPNCNNQLVKDVLWRWDFATNNWIFTDNVTTWSYWNTCWYNSLPNSDWNTCNDGFYITWLVSQPKCESVSIWEYWVWWTLINWQFSPIAWSPSNSLWGWRFKCTNKPSNSYYNWNWGWSNDCPWKCDAWYVVSPNGNSCIQDKCKWDLPSNASSNSQQSAGKDWIYDASPWSNDRCTFKCDDGYNWNGNSCVACASWETWDSGSKSCKTTAISCTSAPDIVLSNWQTWKACNVGAGIVWVWNTSYWNYFTFDNALVSCPSWYHLPTHEEWQSVYALLWNNLLTSLNLPLAWLYDSAWTAYGIGSQARYRSSTSISAANDYSFYSDWTVFSTDSTNSGWVGKTGKLSVRCLKDKVFNVTWTTTMANTNAQLIWEGNKVCLYGAKLSNAWAQELKGCLTVAWATSIAWTTTMANTNAQLIWEGNKVCLYGAKLSNAWGQELKGCLTVAWATSIVWTTTMANTNAQLIWEGNKVCLYGAKLSNAWGQELKGCLIIK